jgi:hypothetical protein
MAQAEPKSPDQEERREPVPGELSPERLDEVAGGVIEVVKTPAPPAPVPPPIPYPNI